MYSRATPIRFGVVLDARGHLGRADAIIGELQSAGQRGAVRGQRSERGSESIGRKLATEIVTGLQEHEPGSIDRARLHGGGVVPKVRACQIGGLSGSRTLFAPVACMCQR
jgi:hypothetical protein